MADPARDSRTAPETSSRRAVLRPVLAGLLLDLLDFATYGPIGLYLGLLLGTLGGYFLAASMGVEGRRRLGYAAVAGVYCMLPFTAFVPVATLVGSLIQLRERAPAEGPRESPRGSIDADYEARWDDD